MNVPNALTLLRLLLCPLFLLLYLYPASFGLSTSVLPFVLLLLFALSEASDALDGWAARRFDQVTELGKILDPMADSIARTSAFLIFTQPPVELPIVLVFIFIYRDSLISTLRTICALKGFTLAARLSGKIKAAIQAVTICLILLLMAAWGRGVISSDALSWGATSAATIAAIYTLYTIAEYVTANKRYVTQLLKS